MTTRLAYLISRAAERAAESPSDRAPQFCSVAKFCRPLIQIPDDILMISVQKAAEPRRKVALEKSSKPHSGAAAAAASVQVSNTAGDLNRDRK